MLSFVAGQLVDKFVTEAQALMGIDAKRTPDPSLEQQAAILAGAYRMACEAPMSKDCRQEVLLTLAELRMEVKRIQGVTCKNDNAPRNDDGNNTDAAPPEALVVIKFPGRS